MVRQYTEFLKNRSDQVLLTKLLTCSAGRPAALKHNMTVLPVGTKHPN